MSRLIDQLKSQFFEANAALNLFIARPPSDQVPRANWQNDTDRRNALQTQLECSFHGTPSDANREELRRLSQPTQIDGSASTLQEAIASVRSRLIAAGFSAEEEPVDTSVARGWRAAVG